MDGGGVTNMGPSSPFERLSDDLMLRILVLAAESDSDDTFSFKPEYGAVDKIPSGKYAALDKLCQLRMVCSHFDRLIPQVENVLWELDEGQFLSARGIQFLQENQSLKCIRLSRPPQTVENQMSLAFLLAVPRAKPQLEVFEVFGADVCPSHSKDEETHILFRVLSTCPKLRMLRSLRCSADVYKPLSARHSLKSLRTLELKVVFISDACINTILHACPSLENLAIEEVELLENPVINSSTLQRLSIMSECGIASVTLQTPELRYLEAYNCERLVVNAPLLDQLVLGDDWHISKEAPWQVSVLNIAYAFEPMGKLIALFKLCPDVKVLTMRAASVLATHEGPWIPKMMLSHLLAPLLCLESIDIPHNMTGVLDLQQDPLLLRPFAKLQHLKIGFENMHVGALESVIKLTKTAPVLKSIHVDLQTLRFRLNISAVVIGLDSWFLKFVRFQRDNPRLDISVKWPEKCEFRC